MGNISGNITKYGIYILSTKEMKVFFGFNYRIMFPLHLLLIYNDDFQTITVQLLSQKVN
jgi:hypothetical protein